MIRSTINNSKITQQTTQEHLYSDIRESWELFPKDQDGTITQDTLRGILSDQGIEISKEDLQSMFDLMDKNKDGKLDLKDFAQYQDC